MPDTPDFKKDNPTKTVPCPTCGKSAIWSPENRWRPFCCERCRMIDLGEWFSESHRIPDETSEENTDAESISLWEKGKPE